MASNHTAMTELREIRRLLAVTGSGKVVQEMKVALAQAARELIQQGFDQSKDPDGKKWAPRKDDKPHPLLIKTKRLMQGWRSRVIATGIELGTEVLYARALNDGTEKMPARRMVPFNLKSLPTKWEKAFKAAEAKVAKRFKL